MFILTQKMHICMHSYIHVVLLVQNNAFFIIFLV
jgi:hypothetical protein